MNPLMMSRALDSETHQFYYHLEHRTTSGAITIPERASVRLSRINSDLSRLVNIGRVIAFRARTKASSSRGRFCLKHIGCMGRKTILLYS